MIHTTKGIIFHTAKFKESGVLARMFTKDFGPMSCIVPSVHGKKAKVKPASLLPLTLVEAIIYVKDNRGLQKLTELKIDPPYKSIHTDIRKTCIALFLSEVLQQVLKEDSNHENIFNFLHHSLQAFDEMDEGINYFHLYLLFELTGYLGFYPSGKFSEKTPYFNLPDGVFQEHAPIHAFCLNRNESSFAQDILNADLNSLSELDASPSLRSNLLDRILDYYKFHIAEMREIKSKKVLTEIMG